MVTNRPLSARGYIDKGPLVLLERSAQRFARWLRCQRVRFFFQATRKKSGVQKVRFPYVASNKKHHFWLLAAITGFGGPGVPEGSTFQWSVLRAAKKFEPSSEMVSKL